MTDQPQDAEDVTVDVRSIFGFKSRQPLVELQFGETVHVMRPDEARTVGRLLFECAEAADMDGLVVAFLSGTLGLSFDQTLVVLREWRGLRQAKYGKQL